MASKETVVVPQAVADALKEFRSDGSGNESRFIVLSYASGSKNELAVRAAGDGGAKEAFAQCGEDDGNYVLLRFEFQVEVSTTVKFVYIDYCPAGTRPMRKALLSTHKGQVDDLVKPYHVSVQADDESEFDDEKIRRRVGASAGTLSHVTGGRSQYGLLKKGAERGKDSQANSKHQMVPKGVRDERSVAVDDEKAVAAAIADVRDDSTPTEWALISYQEGSTKYDTLALVGSGEGGVDALRDAMSDAGRYFYGIFRTTYTVDESEVVRFGFVRVLSERVSPMQRGRIATHIGFIKTLIGQYHVEFNLDTAAELTTDAVDNAIRDVMFINDKTSAAPDQPAAAAAAAPKSAARHPAVPKQALSTESKVSFDDEAAVRAAVAAVHDDSSSTAWALCGYRAKHTLTLVAQGDGDADEMMAAASADGFYIGVVRVTEKIDLSVTVKFALVKLMNPTVKPMLKGEIGTVIGKLEEVFVPYHVDLTVDAAEEVTAAVVADKVSKASMARG